VITRHKLSQQQQITIHNEFTCEQSVVSRLLGDQCILDKILGFVKIPDLVKLSFSMIVDEILTHKYKQMDPDIISTKLCARSAF
jgi:hypothetical protein